MKKSKGRDLNRFSVAIITGRNQAIGSRLDRVATTKAKKKLTPKFKIPMPINPNAAGTQSVHTNAAGSIEVKANVNEPDESVMWRMSIGRPKNFPRIGTNAKRKPIATLPPIAEAL